MWTKKKYNKLCDRLGFMAANLLLSWRIGGTWTFFFLLTHLTHSLAFFTRMTTAMMAARHAGEKESFVSFFEWSFLVLLFLFNKKLQTKLESSEWTWHFFQVEKKLKSQDTHTHKPCFIFNRARKQVCGSGALFVGLTFQWGRRRRQRPKTRRKERKPG